MRSAHRPTPRTGVVRYGSPGRVRRTAHWLLALALASALAGVAWWGGPPALIAAGATAVPAGVLITGGLRTGLLRFTAAGVVAVVAFVSVSGLLPDTRAILAVVLAVTGLLVVRNGRAARIRFLRDAPEPGDEIHAGRESR